jgi:TonB family protein
MRRSGKGAVFLMMAVWWAIALASDDGTSVNRKLPQFQFVMSKGQDWYGATAKRQGLEGRVLVAFNITTDGQAKDVSVIWTEDSVLGANTLQLMKAIRFKMPPDWGPADVWRRWQVGFVYRLCPSGQPGEFAIPVEPIYITGSRLPGAPVRTMPVTKESDACTQSR